MRLTAELAGDQHELNIKREGARVFAEVDGREYELWAQTLSAGEYLLLADARVYRCRVERKETSGESVEVHVGNRAHNLKLFDPKRLRGAQIKGAVADGQAQIIAPMPGKIVRVLVEEGAEVAAGESIIVVEAMKMQNEMKSPKAGTVIQLRAETGATVNPGDVLAVIE